LSVSHLAVSIVRFRSQPVCIKIIQPAPRSTLGQVFSLLFIYGLFCVSVNEENELRGFRTKCWGEFLALWKKEFKSNWMRWAEHVARMANMRRAHWLFWKH